MGTIVSRRRKSGGMAYMAKIILKAKGRVIHRVAAVSGHRSWQSLQRYTHLGRAGDKWARFECP